MRACRSVVVLGALAYCALVLAATPASAKLAAKPLSFSLGPVGTPNALSIDQGTGDVYVTDHATNTVKVFGAEGGAPTGGAPAEVTGASTPSRAFNFLGQNEPAGIAVDAAGNLYVADVGNKVVDRFKLEGGEYKYVCQFTGFGNAGNGCLPNLTTQETHPTKSFTGPGGIAIDSKGNIYVSDFSGAVYEFNSSDEDVREAHIPSGEPSGLAVDANGVVYVQDYQGPVYKLTLNVTNEFEVAEFDAEKSFAVAVDPINNNVYVDHRVYIDLYESGAIILEIRPSGEMLSEGVAVRVKGASRYLYASNTRRARIEVFEFTKTPDVRLNGEAPVVGVHSAMVHGEINPQETGQPSYFFEYGLNHQFTFSSLSIPVASVNEFVPAAAELTELQPNTEYSYRLVGTNSSELFEKSSGGTFRTLTARPEVAAVKAGEVTANGVLFSGEVNPENTPPATYRFEYYEPGGGFQSLPRIAIGAGDSPVPVEQALPAGLRPGTRYGYRLVAANSAGETASAVQFFTTPSAPSHHSAVSISQNGAVLTGSIVPNGLPALYEFEIGTTPAYGTILFGGGVEAGSEQEVMQAVGSLQPGVIYHYRLVASSTAGAAAGPDRTFITMSQAGGIAQPVTLPILAIPVFPPVKYPVKKPQKRKHHKHGKAPKARTHPRAGSKHSKRKPH